MADRHGDGSRPGTRGERRFPRARDGAAERPPAAPEAEAARLLRGRDDDSARACSPAGCWRRGIAGAAIVLPAIGFALGPGVRGGGLPLAGRRPAEQLHRDHYTPVTFTLVADVGERARRSRTCASATRQHRRGPHPDPFIAISTRCAHLGCPVRWVGPPAAVRVPVSRRRLQRRLVRSGRAAGAAARPLQDERQNGQVQLGPRFSVNSELEALLPARPGRAAGWPVAVPVPEAPNGALSPP